MLKGVGVVCFTTCYFIAFGLQLARLRFSKDPKLFAVLSFLMTALGAVAHVAFLYYNDLLQNEHFFANAGGWFSVLAFAVVLVGLYLTLVSKTQFSLFLLPLALILVVVSLCAGNVAFTPTATCFWVRATHASALLLTTLLTFFGAICGYMYFWQRNRLRRNVAEISINLPSLEWLSGVCRLAINASVVALGIGVASGFYLRFFSSPASNIDLASAGTPLLFVFALLTRFPKRKARAVDVCAMNAVYNFIVGAALIVFLLFAAFEPSGHWKSLIHNEEIRSGKPITNDDALDVPSSE